MRNRIVAALAAVATVTLLGIGTGVVPASANVGGGNQYYDGTNSYINAWGGGPRIEVYNAQAANNDFDVVQNGSYYNLRLDNGSNSGYDFWCIGDYGNDPNNASAGMVSGCGGSGIGWGGNFTIVYSGCDAGSVSFWNAHWHGWLGPTGDINGDRFYLNNSAQVCYNFRPAY